MDNTKHLETGQENDSINEKKKPQDQIENKIKDEKIYILR